MRIKLLLLIPLFLTMSACVAEPTTKSNSRLNAVKSRNNLICGVSGELPGFSFVDASGNYSGLDVDVCRAIAAALFDNPNAVEFRNLNAKERFTAVQTGEVDILSRNTTWTMSRDTSVGLDFAPVVFYDGQGMMVRQNSNIKSLENLKGKAICTQTGTTNEQNLADQMRKRGITYKPVVFEDINTAYATYEQGRCDAVTSDKSQLISRRTTLPKPEEHVILEQALSQEPLAPAVADGDAKWGDTVRWVVNTIIKAEELGINSENVEQLKTSSKDPEVRRLLGLEGDLGVSIGLTKDFGARIIKHVGNYGEIYDRNLGSKTKLNLPRDNRNQPWTKGGLLYSPPFR
ncbi:MAG: amino acid ABC transporter substrate-binding protein [Richelia sp. RM2_1_2]|nr:amino acid ABC transporter substrate-binding protein [Richelia sp. SM2_1_7]NJM19099.1 amino acid ABC transporter substrate-binding protein [Richelia sp. SM1_7_0]NJN07866.1 amino acid ABC transporter substrate-binding protein [Richelia sp. RM1_1_1]NJO28876.1 amino acid ABC transporter substrate-binding protein [Richelia sp. SL_2_1]NJO64844.1 amino acid ABC transporter substrate-binding protein [Richelia sp. RM2_1_2]